jgi:hypothetical protein
MRHILLLSWVLAVGFFASENLPTSPKETEGKSVYIPIPPSVDVAEDGCVQKEDQNSSGYRNAKE